MPVKDVLVVSTDFSPLIGGTATHTEQLCAELADNNLNVTLLTYGNDIDDYDKKQKYSIYRINSTNNYSYFYRYIIIQIKLALAVGRYNKKHDIDLIHVCNGYYLPLALKLVKTNKPVIWTVHNIPPAEMSMHILKNKILNTIFVRILYILCDAVSSFPLRCGKYNQIISVSEYTRQKILNKGISSDKISVIKNGVSVNSLNVPKTNNEVKKWFNIVVVARVVQHKGQLELVKAMPKILTHISNARCIIVGEMISKNYMERIDNEITLNAIRNDRVILTGKLSDDELNTVLSDCDVYIQPSYEEGFCIAILEAMVRGIPVIGTRCGEIPEFIGDERGILIPRPDPDMIAKAIITYHSDPIMMKKYAENGRTYISEKYGWDEIGRETIKTYNKFISPI